MKKGFLFAIVLIFINALTAYFLPWWSVALASAILAYSFRMSPLISFSIAFVSVTFLYIGVAYVLFIRSDSRLTEMISGVFMNIGTYNLILLTGLIGGLTAGFGSWVGSSAREFIMNK